MRAFFMTTNDRRHRGTVIATTLLRKTIHNPEYMRLQRSNFNQIKETGSNEENHQALIIGLIRPIDGC